MRCNCTTMCYCTMKCHCRMRCYSRTTCYCRMRSYCRVKCYCSMRCYYTVRCYWCWKCCCCVAGLRGDAEVVWVPTWKWPVRRQTGARGGMGNLPDRTDWLGHRPTPPGASQAKVCKGACLLFLCWSWLVSCQPCHCVPCHIILCHVISFCAVSYYFVFMGVKQGDSSQSG